MSTTPATSSWTASAGIQDGDRPAAERAERALRLRLEGDANPRGKIMLLELQALLALDEGDGSAAVALLEEAVEIEEGLPFEFGPPASLKPPHELLGEVALELGAYQAALDAFPALPGLHAGADAVTPRRGLRGRSARRACSPRTTPRARLEEIRRAHRVSCGTPR